MSELSQIISQLQTIENRLSVLETKTGLRQQPQIQPLPTEKPPEINQDPKKTTSFSDVSSGHFLGIVGVICFVLAAGFIIKLALDSGWLTPLRQIGLAITLGLGLIAAGFVLFKKDRSYASLLPAAGIIILYSSAFAAYRIHHLISFELGIACVTFVSGLCLVIYVELTEEIYPLIAVMGSYAAPNLFGISTNGQFDIIYYILCSSAFATISILLESRLVALVGAYLAIAITSWQSGSSIESQQVTAYLLPIHFLIYTFSTWAHGIINKKSLSANQAWYFFPILLFFYATEYKCLHNIIPEYAPWISLAFAGVILGFYFIAKKSQKLQSTEMITTFSAIVFFHSFYLQILPELAKPWVFVAVLAGFIFIKREKSEFSVLLKLILLVLVAIEYLHMANGLLKVDSQDFILVALASLTLLLIAARKHKPMADQVAPRDYIFLILAHGLAILSLYNLSHSAGSLAVSALWLCYAVAILGFGFAVKDQKFAKSSLFVLAFAAGKVLIYDLANADSVVRIFCLLLTGAVLYGCGFLLRQISSWAPPKN